MSCVSVRELKVKIGTVQDENRYRQDRVVFFSKSINFSYDESAISRSYNADVGVATWVDN